MNRIRILALTSAVMAVLLTGCRNRAMDMDSMTNDTTNTTQATHAHTEPAQTQPTTQVQTQPATQSQTEPGTQGSILPEDTDSLPEDTTGEVSEEHGNMAGKIRRNMPRLK